MALGASLLSLFTCGSPDAALPVKLGQLWGCGKREADASYLRRSAMCAVGSECVPALVVDDVLEPHHLGGGAKPRPPPRNGGAPLWLNRGRQCGDFQRQRRCNAHGSAIELLGGQHSNLTRRVSTTNPTSRDLATQRSQDWAFPRKNSPQVRDRHRPKDLAHREVHQSCRIPALQV